MLVFVRFGPSTTDLGRELVALPSCALQTDQVAQAMSPLASVWEVTGSNVNSDICYSEPITEVARCKA
jgi:hypothetical protein